MNRIYKSGFNFGAISGIITTLGLMIGLFYSTRSELAVIGGILTIAVADACSDAFGMHVSTESRTIKSKEIWGATFSTFAAKFFFAILFILPILIFGFGIQAIQASIAFGFLLIGVLSYRLAVNQKEKPIKVLSEHMAITLLVIIATYYLGNWIASVFGAI